jgi:SAM-dependent methyltransferase
MIVSSNCNLCTAETEPIYQPRNSLIGLEILICMTCGFLQSSKSQTGSSAPNSFEIDRLSCDSDYSPIRVGKQQMTESDIENIESSNLEGISNFDFLDMASARGHFATWATTKTSNKVVCFEPDEYMVHTYSDNERIQVHIGDYRGVQPMNDFDFIYSCHTLEHFRSPVDYLNFVYEHLKIQGYFYVNVPNLLGILDVAVLDDFFYDKHRVYFDQDSLCNLLQNQGFKIIAEWVDSACVRFLAIKVEKPKKITTSFNYARNRELMVNYVSALNLSRSSLPSLVNNLYEKLNQGSTRVLLGCGRMLDALITYGKLDLSKFDFLVDNYLGVATKSLYARDLYTLDNLPFTHGDLQFVVISRTSNAELGNRISKQFKNAEVLYFANLTNQ